MSTFKYIFLLLTVCCISFSEQQSQLRVVLYYEGLCPYCQDFIVTQLYPGYQQLGDSIIVDLVPFGKAHSNKTNNEIEWTCQHGPLECYLNKVDACIISFNLTQSQRLSFVYCNSQEADMDKTKEETEALVKQCATDNNISWDDISTCLDNDADRLLLSYEDRQSKLDPKVEYVPNIRFNDIFNEKSESQARFDFVWTVCQLITENKPSVCDDQ